MANSLTRRAVLGAAASLIPIGAWSRSTPSAWASATASADRPTPFRLAITDAALARIKERVRAAHFPTISQGAGWRYGVDATWFRDLVAYWRDGYDWRAAEAQLNRAPQFLATVDGRRLHFARLEPRGGARRRPPLLLLHGWPYSFATMLPLAEMLANDGFEVVVPSLPGYGFSAPADDQVRGLRFLSHRIGRLMTETLGHQRYLVQGGDFGAVVADWLGIDTPQHLLGIHANMIAFRHAGAEYGSGRTGVPDPAPEEIAYAKAEVEGMERESAYFKLQFTRPETIAYALSDSPVGWAAYMLDKWEKWTDTRERPFPTIYHRDRLLTEVMIYLVGDTVATSIWPYAGFATEPFGLEPGQKIAVPFAYSSFPTALLPRMPRRFIERSRPDIRLWREHDTGGHFPMLQATAALAADIRAFADLLG